MTPRETMDAMGLRDRVSTTHLYIRPALEYGIIGIEEPV